MASRSKGPRRRSTCPQLHSSLSCPSWPVTCRAVRRHPLALCFLPLSSSLVLTWTGRWYTKGPVCHQNQGVTGGQRAEVEAVPGRGWPHQWSQRPVAPLWRGIEAEKKQERDLHWLALHSSSGDISFVWPLTDPASTPSVGWVRELADNGGPPSQMGVGKIANVVSTIKTDRPQPCLMWPMTSSKA